ncbi:zinc ribbon domain-containing protein [Lyngbya aestuarii]|uniref:zinc ribbon domain-containing protein n=1 Tax=Lyngbya aestuarii TaxID=118322 RepID=UPI00403D73F3
MPNCPKCHQPIGSQMVTCSHCGTVLKAYGHPGITLHRAREDQPLCESCTYHADDTCTFPQRPYAQECTLYNDISQAQVEIDQIYVPRSLPLQTVRLWCQRNPALLGLLGLVAVSFLLTLIAF